METDYIIGGSFRLGDSNPVDSGLATLAAWKTPSAETQAE